jgi:NAD(P)-dependent dehydrogenase (short-subunit alcohol dehydrogenase family)
MPDALLHHSDRDTPPDEATPDWDNSPSFYCFNFLTQGEADKMSNAKTPLDVPWIEPEAIAPAVVFLASDADKAYMVSGATLRRGQLFKSALNFQVLC